MRSIRSSLFGLITAGAMAVSATSSAQVCSYGTIRTSPTNGYWGNSSVCSCKSSGVNFRGWVSGSWAGSFEWLQIGISIKSGNTKHVSVFSELLVTGPGGGGSGGTWISTNGVGGTSPGDLTEVFWWQPGPDTYYPSPYYVRSACTID